MTMSWWCGSSNRAKWSIAQFDSPTHPQRHRSVRVKQLGRLAQQVGALELENVGGAPRSPLGHDPRGLPLARQIDERLNRPRVPKADVTAALADTARGDPNVLFVMDVVAALAGGERALEQLDQLLVVEVRQCVAAAAVAG